IDAQPADESLRLRRAWAFFFLEQMDRALAECDAAIRLGTPDKDILFLRGHALVRLGRLDEALTAYDQALKTNPRSGPLWLSRGLAHGRPGQGARAADDCQRAFTCTQAILPQIDVWWEQRHGAGVLELPLEWNVEETEFTQLLDSGTTDAWVWRGRALAR